ncbi:MAG: ABC transporter ATP-binding protein [Merismopediaceae bacterium]|nr:ABC transporter ATP-binding protein [Merismopediaceae bacterium]
MKAFIQKFFYVVGTYRRYLLSVLFFFTLTSLIDAIGIGLIGPFINIASSPQRLAKYPLAQAIADGLNLPNLDYLIPLLGLTIVVIFLLQFLLYFIAQGYIFNFIAKLKTSLTVRLSQAYLQAPYIFHLTKNSATIGKNIAIETHSFVAQCLSPLMRVVTNGIILIVLLLLLAKTDFTFLLLILLTIVPVAIAFKYFSPRLKQWGKTSSVAQERILTILNHAFGSIKDTKIIGSENYFLDQIESQVKLQSQASSNFQFFQIIPPLIVKNSLVIFLILFVSIGTVFFAGYMKNIAGVMTVFAVAAIRLIPSLNLIIQGLGQIKNNLYTLDVLYTDLKEVETQTKSLPKVALSLSESHTLSFNRELTIENLSFAYPQVEELALKEIRFKINRGESIGFIGKSGSGKTTLVDVILGLLKPQSGDILVDGISIYEDLRGWQNLIGYIPQSIFLTDETIEENIGFGIPQGQIDQARLAQVIKTAQLEDLIAQSPQGLKTPVGERGVRLSGGQRQRIGIARALYHEREILVLDEATSALDNETEQLVSDAIKALSGQKTLLIIAHRLTTLEHCDRLYVLEKGRIVRAGSYQEIVLNAPPEDE